MLRLPTRRRTRAIRSTGARERRASECVSRPRGPGRGYRNEECTARPFAGPWAARRVAGKNRIVLGSTAGAPSPIPPERLAAWWRAAETVQGREAADLFRLMLLTGARGGELKAVCVRDVDLEGGRIVLRDTKNRTDHTLLLSTEAARVVAPYVEGKRPGSKLFTVADPRKTLTTINRAAGVQITPHDLRATFASVAEELVSAYTLKRMLNHAEAGDVTGAHYVGKSETQLRAGWQAVADFIAGSTAPKAAAPAS